MGITKFAVKYPVSVLMITLGVCLLESYHTINWEQIYFPI